MKLVQWIEHDDGVGYSVAGPTVDQLPPGMYDLVVTQTGIVWIPVDTRTDDLIRFPNTPSQAVVNEVERFWGLEALFTEHGLPFKRGILLWGPPGSGKTCTLRQVAEDVVKREGYVLIFRKIEPFLAGYRQLRAVHPEAPLVVIMEDIDALLGDQRENNVSALLNLLDGVEDVARVVFLATTNFPERLGPRIANRPSRFDRRIKIAHPDEPARKLYLESLLRASDDTDVSKLVHDSEGMSLAHLKELFVATEILGADYGDTLRELQGMRELPNSVVNDEEEFRMLFGIGSGGYA